MKRGRNETEENKEENRKEYLGAYMYLRTYVAPRPLFGVYRHSLDSSSVGTGEREGAEETSPSSRIAPRVVKDE